MKKSIILFFGLMAFTLADAQNMREVRRLERSGNGQYAEKRYQDAEMDYRRALGINPADSVARFNLATTLIRQQDQAKLAEADSILTGLISEAEQQGNRPMAARSLYQKGEIAMMAQQYQQAADAYKESLKRNPTDDEARFNYLLAKKQLEKQQQQNQDKKDDDKKQDQQKQDQQQQQQDQQKQQEQQKPEDKQQQQQQQQNQEQQPQQMSEDQRQSILEQNERDEKETQAKVMRRQLDKDKDKKREMEIKRMNGTLKDW